MPNDLAQDEAGRPRLVGYVFLRDRIGWAILGVLIVTVLGVAYGCALLVDVVRLLTLLVSKG